MDKITASSDVSKLKEDKNAQTVQSNPSEDLYARLVASHINRNMPQLADAITQGAAQVGVPALIAGSSLPGYAKGLLTAIGGFGKGFVEAHDNQIKRDMELRTSQDKFMEDLQKRSEPILNRYEANSDIKDEYTVHDAINKIEQILNDPNSANNREAMGAIRANLMQVYRPEFKRLANGETADFGSLTGIANNLAKKGALNMDELLNEAIKGGGVLDENTKNEIQNILDNSKELSRSRFANAAQTYVNDFKTFFNPQVGGYLAEQLLRKPDDTYTISDYQAPKEPAKVTNVSGVLYITPKGNKTEAQLRKDYFDINPDDTQDNYQVWKNTLKTINNKNSK